MKLFPLNLLSPLTVVSLLGGVASAKSSAPFCGLTTGNTIPSTQPLEGEVFIGTSVSAKPQYPKFQYYPRSFQTHLDGANTRSLDYPGPIGRNLNITTSTIRHGLFFWDDKGTQYSGYGGPCNGSDPATTPPTLAFSVVEPETLGFEAVWQPPAKYANVSLLFVYAQLLVETSDFVLPTAEGQIFILKKHKDMCGYPSIELKRTIDLRATGVLGQNALLNAQVDTAGNVWFTTGVLGNAGSAQPTNSSIIGYVQKNGTIHTTEIPNQAIENNIALSNTTIYFVTGPSAADDHANAIGTVQAMRASPGGVHVKWNSTYLAGDRKKPNAFARGSGTSPGLLGDKFMVVTDNANTQMNLLVFPQNSTGQDVKPVCTVPLFEPNSSWSDNSFIKHFDGKDYSIVAQNMYNEILFNQSFSSNPDDGALNNNLTVQSPGLQKVFIAGDGSDCHVEWTNPVRMNTAPVLSTATGLIYGYEQSEQLANEGEWVWYANAIDFETGETVWKVRTGVGGSYNNYYKTAFLSPDGTFYHPVSDGVVGIKDGDC